MAVVLALLAAGANALATVLQRLGVEESRPKRPGILSLMTSLLKRPIWFAGLALTTASFLLQALALSLGDLTTVQPVMVTEILFLVIILGLFFGGGIGWREWIGATGTMTGLGVFLAVSGPGGGTARPSYANWALLLIAALGAVLVALVASGRGSRSWRAACRGVAAGILFALTAAFIKTAADQWPLGVGYVFTHFEAYGVAIAGLVGFVVNQSALDLGPVAASQAALLIVNPLSSIAMGLFLFGDRLITTPSHLALETASLLGLFLGLFVLSGSRLITATAVGERLSSRPVREVAEGCRL